MENRIETKIVTLDLLKELIENGRKSGEIIVSTSGCFDIVHAGHVMYLEEAKHKGDKLVVLLNSDSSVRMLKGDKRPIVPEKERAIVIAALSSVDYVCIFSEKTPCGIVGEIKPDIVVKGGDYDGKWIPEMDTVAVYGGKVEYVNIVEGCSTTNIVKKIEQMVRND